MQLKDIQARLAERCAMVRNGELSERGLAPRAGISQPHRHNVLKGKDCLSMQTADIIMRELGLNVFDSIREGERGKGRELTRYSVDCEVPGWSSNASGWAHDAACGSDRSVSCKR